MDHKCDSCGKSFTQLGNMKNHIKTVHEGQINYKCDSCEKSFAQSGNLKKHIKTIHEQKWKCTACEMTFFKSISLRKHKKKIHSVGNTYHKCEYCSKIMSTKNNLNRHIKNVHSSTNDQKYIEDVPEIKTELTTNSIALISLDNRQKVQKYYCDLCMKNFTTKYNLKDHVDNVHKKQKNYTCLHCKKSFFQKGCFKKHSQRIHDKKCASCDMSFLGNISLKMHEKNHHKIGPSLLPVLKNGIYYFSKKDKLKLHQQNVHTNKKMAKSFQEYVCDLCMKKLSTKANLMRHIENVHVKMENSADVTSTKIIQGRS